MTKVAALIGRTILITGEDDAKMLVLEVALDCPDCGQHAIRLAGHHLRTLKQLLDAVIEANPDLTGRPEGATVVEQYEWTGNGGGDPSLN